MATLDTRAAQLVRDTKGAIVHANRELAKQGLKITKVDLELRVDTVSSGGAGISVQLAGIGADMGADHNRDSSSSLHLSLVPDLEASELMGSVPEDFVAAIVAISAATAEAAAYPPEFDLDEAVVSFDVDVTNSGQFQFVLRGSRSKSSGSTMAITLAPT
jgi:Trypsin-co-occurring domain 2